jgi:c(7)-type cytochrome triheme protein
VFAGFARAVRKVARCVSAQMPAYHDRGRLVRNLFLLGIVSATLGATLAADSIVLAGLKAAPNVAPVEDPPPARAEDAVVEMHPARLALERNPIHDESNPDYHRLQRIDEATRDIKRDAVGFPDWMAALRSGAISPLAGMSPRERMNVLDLNVVMKNTKEMPHVLFPHLSHTLWLDCSNCHPSPFLPKVGANQVSMSEIFRGKYCGMCHDRVAFITFFSCDRCHSVPQKSSLDAR